MATGTPRDLDPKFKEEKPPVDPEVEPKEVSDESLIVFRQNITNPDGTAGEVVHGPMPVADWPAYEKEHKL